MSEQKPCAACKAAWGEIDSGCLKRHDSIVLEVAAKLAEAVGHHNPTLQQVGWFADDAEAVVGELGQQDSWHVVFTMETVRSPDGYDPIIEVNGVSFRCVEGPMTPYNYSSSGAKMICQQWVNGAAGSR